jgi:hypothetical protein
MRIAKTSGKFIVRDIITCAGNWVYESGIAEAASGSTLVLRGSFSLDGEGTSGGVMLFHHLLIHSGTRTVAGKFNARGNLAILSGAVLSATGTSHIINVGGKWTNQNTTGGWNAGSTSVVFDGGGDLEIFRAGGAAETFTNIAFNRIDGRTTLKCTLNVTGSMTLTKGRIIAAAGRHLSFADNATCTGGGVGAYVCGPVRKTGNDAFVFPLGDTLLPDSSAWHPLAMSAPVTSSEYEATYLHKASANANGAKADTLDNVSNCEYWVFERKTGTADVILTFSWNQSSCLANGTEDMTMAKWNGTQWERLASTIVSYNDIVGQIALNASISASTPIQFVIATNKLSTLFVPSSSVLDGFTARSFGKKLYVIYDEKYIGGSLSYSIYDMQNTPINTESAPVNKVYGRNWLIFDLSLIPGLYLNKYYILEIQNEKGQKEYVRFCLK